MISRLVSALVSPLCAPLGDGGGVKSRPPVISGNAYPGELLTSTRSGQWYVGGVPAGTSTTYLVGIRDIGLAIYQTAGGLQSNTLTCWSPSNEAGVAEWWVGNSRVYNSISPNVDATDGQTVRQWAGKNGATADQTTAANQPLSQRVEINGQDVVQFDGTNDFMDTTASMKDVFRNKSVGGIIVGCSDNGGATVRYPIWFSTVGGGTTRLSIRFVAGSSAVQPIARRLDGDSAVSSTAVAVSGYNCIHAESLWSSGVLNLRVNGSQSSSVSYAASGNTSDTSSTLVQFGNGETLNRYLNGNIGVIIFYNAALTANARARLERFTMLYGGVASPPAYTSAA